MFNSKTPLDKAIDAILGHEIRRLNTHLPKERRNLRELLGDRDPSVRTVDGSEILFNKEELQKLATIVPEEYHDRLKLPLILLRRMELGKSVYTVSGDRVEEFTVKKILGLTDDSFHQIYRIKEPLVVYRPQISELLAKFHSLIVVGFGISKELSDYAPSRD